MNTTLGSMVTEIASLNSLSNTGSNPVVIILKNLEIMIINEWDKEQNLFFVRDLDYDRNMFIGTMDECKKFMIDYNNNQE